MRTSCTSNICRETLSSWRLNVVLYELWLESVRWKGNGNVRHYRESTLLMNGDVIRVSFSVSVKVSVACFYSGVSGDLRPK